MRPRCAASGEQLRDPAAEHALEPARPRPRPSAENAACDPGLLSRAMSDAPVSVVTGANSGIGRATAIHLAQQGHTVYGTHRATSRMDTFHKMAETAGVEIRLVE